MSLLNKVKNFFYEEVEVDEAEEARKEEEKRRIKEQRREERKKAAMEKIERFKPEKKPKEEPEFERRIEVPKEIPVVKNEDISERELFKSERTFNFPMDMGDDIFDEGENTVVEEKPKEEPKKTYTRPVVPSRYENISTVRREPVKEEVDEGPHKFKPSPVISPVYGILDKNYTVDDVKEKNLSKTKEFSIEKKIVDFDSVRNKAYKELDEEIERTLTESKDIFYNLDEEPTLEKEIKDEIDDYKEEEHNAEEDVVITFEDEEPSETNIEIDDVEDNTEVNEPEEEQQEEDEEDDFTPDVAIVKETRTSRRAKKTKKEDKKEKKESDEKEDLFNLIDNMYNDEDEEDDE